MPVIKLHSSRQYKVCIFAYL